MSGVEDKGRVDYSKFDNIDSDILEAYLRADFDAPEDEQLEPEAIIYIVNLLLEREDDGQIDWEKKKAESLARFWEEYYPHMDEILDLMDFDEDFDKSYNRKIVVSRRLKKFGRMFSKVMAGLLVFAAVSVITASAFGYDPIKFVGRWDDEQFSFAPVTVTSELADVVAEYAGDTDLVPKKLLNSFIFDKVKVSKFPSYICINAEFYKDTYTGVDRIYIDYRFPFTINNIPEYEKDFANVEIYEINGTEYYIMEDLGDMLIIWQNGDVLGSIKGNFSLAEAKKIINSIYEE